MNEFLKVIREAMPEIIGGLVVAAVLAVIGALYSGLGIWAAALIALAGLLLILALFLFLAGRRVTVPTKKRKEAVVKRLWDALLNLDHIRSPTDVGSRSKLPNDLSDKQELALPCKTYLGELREELKKGLEQVRYTIADMEVDALNWKPLDSVNSIYVLAKHITGAAEEWVCCYVGGMHVERDRPAEFKAKALPPLYAQPLKAHIGEVMTRIEQVFDDLDESDLSQVVVPEGKLRGPCTKLSCLVHVVEHTNSHYAELKLIKHFYDYLMSSPSRR